MAILGRARFAAVVAAGDDDNYDYDYVDDYVNGDGFDGGGVSLRLLVSRNHQSRSCSTTDIGDNLPPSPTVFGCSLAAVEV